MPFRTVGSIWGKWDLHFHTPSSFDYSNGSVTDNQLIEGLAAADVAAVAVTDHHIIDVQRIKALTAIAKDKITIFPAIELRSELGGKESVHLIGIFPETMSPEYIWTKLQGQLNLTPTEIQQKGNENVYVRFEFAANLIHELGGIVSVHVGRKSNSIESIGNNHPYKQAFKKDLARNHIDLFEIGRPADALDYRNIVFPEIGLERPLIVCSDNHDISDYTVKANCWIKADPVFVGFQQVISEPQERVFLGDIPPASDRVRKNSTKYVGSISFTKVAQSTLNEDWFSGKIPLNSGLIAVIGNKGTGKTALVETIGLLGNTAQHHHFSFLNPDKFRQPKNNKARNFQATLEWEDGRTSTKSLADSVEPDSLESVVYIPQNYLELICNEIQTSESRFDRELKSVIFSHVDEANKLGADSLDQLLKFLTEQTRVRLDQLRAEISEINQQVVSLEQLGSAEARQFLLNLADEKKRELEAHEKLMPAEIQKPATDPSNQQRLEAIAGQIAEKQERKMHLEGDLKQMESVLKISALSQAVAERILQRLSNFEAQYEAFIKEATPDCLELHLNPRELVKIQIDRQTPSDIGAGAKLEGETARDSKENLEKEIAMLQQDVEDLTQQLDLPNLQYQTYLQNFEKWVQRRGQIIGDPGQAGTLHYIEKQIAGLQDIPERLKQAISNRDKKARETYRQLEQLVTTYRSLYNPVQRFIEEHSLSAAKFNFTFEASVMCSGLEAGLFTYINQGRRGSFCGGDEGRGVLKNLIAKADFDSEDGAVSFAGDLLDHLTHDKREYASPGVSLDDQLKKGMSKIELLSYIFSFSYLSPRYSLKWSGKNIEELSPGERGTLLLIFYLLIDRRDTPLIIDQPEENLDNQTVYELLVPCIKEARKKRQVIIVTHNPNLAVVCDADQVVHCTIDKQNKNKVTYEAGSLENPSINKFTIDVLEGTRPAFDRRDEKYHEK